MAEPDAVADIVTLCSRLPLALPSWPRGPPPTPGSPSRRWPPSSGTPRAAWTASPAEAAVWDCLGYVRHQLGHQQAVTCYQHALELTRELGDHYNEANVLTHLGETHRAVSDIDAARSSWQQAATILDRLSHPDADRVRDQLALLT